MPSALITGSNRGLGFEFARQYLAEGWRVHAACRDPNSAGELRRLVDASGHKARAKKEPRLRERSGASRNYSRRIAG
jgi:NAD(P)-dependent dehydrogenase (short-subunit alcohol dehydrogenase family)